MEFHWPVAKQELSFLFNILTDIIRTSALLSSKCQPLVSMLCCGSTCFVVVSFNCNFFGAFATLLLPEVKGSDADVFLTQETERVKHREKIWVDWGPKFIKEQSIIEGQSVIETQMVWSVKCKLALLWPRRVSPLYPAPSVAGSSVNKSVHILLEFLRMINEVADMLHRVVVEHVRSSKG